MIAFHVARERVHTSCVEEAVLNTARKLQGAYGLVIMSPRKLIGVRDPYGLKPLCLGKRDNAYVLASESCALTSVGAEFIRDIEPGEMITISRKGCEIRHDSCRYCEKPVPTVFFEYIYFCKTGQYHGRCKGL